MGMGKLDDDPHRYAMIREPEADHDHRNLRVVRTSRGSDQILELVSHGDGLPEAIGVAGTVKCAICTGYAEDSLVCEECKAAVAYLRSAANLNHLVRLVELMQDRPYIITLFERMTDEAISEFFLRQLPKS